MSAWVRSVLAFPWLLAGCFYEVPDLPGAQASTGSGTGGVGGTGGATTSSTGAGGCDADLENSKENCGACGHDCRGGSCIVGVCQPATIAVDQPSATGLAVDDEYVYWTTQEANGAVRRALKLSPDVVEDVATSQLGPFDVAVDDTHVYWNCPNDGTVTRVPKGQRSMDSIATGESSPYAIAIDADFVYWPAAASPMGVAVRRAAKAPPHDPQDLGVDDTGVYPYAIAVDDTHVWWTDRLKDAVMRIPKTGGTPETVAPLSSGARPRGIVSAEGAIWWVEQTGRVMRWQGGRATQVATGAGNPRDIAVHGGDIYWSEHEGSAIRWAGQTEPLAEGENLPHDIATDGLAVYWTNYGGNNVRLLVR